jgi:hypothetical protein
LWWTKWHWDRFFFEFFGFPCQYYSTVALHTQITWGKNNRHIGGHSPDTQSHSIDMNNNKLFFVMVKCCVLFEVRTALLIIIWTSFGFKGLNRGFISLNNINQLIIVMVKCGVLFEVRAEFLNII